MATVASPAAASENVASTVGIISATNPSSSTMAQPAPSIRGAITIPTVLPSSTINSVPVSGVTPVSVTAVLKTTPGTATSSVSDRLGPVTGSDVDKVLNKQRLQDLVREVDPNEQLDEDVEELLLQIADDFIENVVTSSCLLAKHRRSSTLDVKDVQLTLEKNWNMWIPGFGVEERPYKRSATTESHKQRMALIRKTLKK
ncbi:transcription initiation factor TFIID subunit 12-like isoform X2 [Tachypleus tridentatus]|uniref:transcription initiation factor TFIID subunit 12-like isoform X2 n=1 Tax=Tachypleus tridentatus TaxID=6853 RepID=UPI003FD37951